MKPSILFACFAGSALLVGMTAAFGGQASSDDPLPVAMDASSDARGQQSPVPPPVVDSGIPIPSADAGTPTPPRPTMGMPAPSADGGSPPPRGMAAE